ncbi:MAG: hypothetical protein BHW44_10890 [Roseburia sp. 40_7]|nr:MAG: hypothetical protein BHW44_10890 [Roseburia sp. 40_7]
MQKQEIKQEKMSADVLIIGGGIAGLTAAISVKEENPDISVLVVEKQTSGYSGKANKGGGVLQYFDLWIRWNPGVSISPKNVFRQVR